MCGVPPWNKGKRGLQKQSEETLQKRFSTECRRKMSIAKKGKDPWNRGKVGVQVSTEEVKKKQSDALKGRPHDRVSCIICKKECSVPTLTQHINRKHNI